jgi:voltage-gated potassium channel
MTDSNNTHSKREVLPADHFLSRLYRFLMTLNDLLLIPMFLLIVQEIENGEISWLSLSTQDLMLNILFFTEWALGLYLAPNRKEYSLQVMRMLDLISCFPFSTLTQGVRLARLARVVKIIRLISRAKRYRGVGEEMIRTLSLVTATVFAGAYSFVVVEPNHPHVNSIWDALWWSLVTVSTVGYGDVVPETMMGRLIAAPLIIVGVGVVGYTAGFMSTLMASSTVKEEEAHFTEIENRLKELNQKMNRLLELQGNHTESLQDLKDHVDREVDD